jgi:hypothetical protein
MDEDVMQKQADFGSTTVAVRKTSIWFQGRQFGSFTCRLGLTCRKLELLMMLLGNHLL